jgi:ADP-ribose pyrophosphatase YjhB (NUDIX family)
VSYSRTERAEEWYSQLPTVYASVGALITDRTGRTLLVKPTYKWDWTVPGGVADEGEPPHLACRREVAEEIGLDVLPGSLLVVNFIPAWGRQRRPIIYFMFDCGRVESADIVLQESELSAHEFRHVRGGDATINRHVVACVIAGLAARRSGTTVYLPGRQVYA